MLPYNPADCYWLVGNKDGEVFASARVAWVAPRDATYQAWLEAGNLPSMIACDGALAHVLVRKNLVAAARGCGTTSFGDLAPGQVAEVLVGLGLTVTSTGNAALNGAYPLDDATQMQVLRRVAAINNNGGNFPAGITSYTQLDVAGEPHSFTVAAEYITWAEALNLYGEQVTAAAMEETPTWPSSAVTIA